MKFGLQGLIDPHIPTNQLNYCEIVSARLRQQTETRLYGGEGGITRACGPRPFGAAGIAGVLRDLRSLVEPPD